MKQALKTTESVMLIINDNSSINYRNITKYKFRVDLNQHLVVSLKEVTSKPHNLTK